MGNQPGKLQHQNQSGRPKKNVRWKTAERPSPPGRPILIPLSDQQPDVVNLSWERPKVDGGSPITGYVVEHRRMGSPHWVRATPTPVPRCEVSISGLEPGWRYQFRVFAENIVGRSDASELSDALTVTLQRNAISVPRFTDELQDTQAVEDERIEFRVRVLGQPTPEISWFKDGYEIFSSRRTKIVNDNDVSVLIIHQVALTDEGEIKCTATNRAGHVVTKAKLMVQAPPRIRLPRTYEDGLIVEADEILRLKVGIAGQPTPNVSWLHEGEIINNEGRFEIINTDRNSMLKIDNIQRDDRGEYSIRASNKLGDDITSFLVTVTARPNAPGKVRINMSFGKSATLSWTSPIDDGGCKIGNYIVEYFRVGWNVWLKAATTRSLSTTLHDLIEGSEYKFRVKAENPYGLSDPSEESDVLFIPDPKRGITKPKSENKNDEKNKPTPPRRKTLSPPRAQQDAATETRVSPSVARKPKPQLIDSEDLHREMSYGTSDQALKMDIRKSPSLSSADSVAQSIKSKLSLNIDASIPVTKSPQRSPTKEYKSALQFLTFNAPQKDKSPSPLTPNVPLATPEPSITPEKASTPSSVERNPTPLTPTLEARKTTATRKSPTPPEPIKNTPALERSAEPVQLGVNQHVRRFSGHSLSPAKHAPALAIAIATGGLGVTINNNANGKQNATTITNPTIQISAPPPNPPMPLTPLTTPETETTPQLKSISRAEKHDDVHTSNEFMLVVFDKNSKVKDKDKQDSFELDLEDAIQPPPISISCPDLASLEFTNLHTFPLRRSVSSTELLYERAMARFYEAVELEEAEKARKVKMSVDKIPTPSNVQPTTIRKRLGSMTEAERLSFEKRSEIRRQSADVGGDLKSALKWSSRENVSEIKPLSRATGMLINKRQQSQESDDLSDFQPPSETNKNTSYELGSDYTESTASSEEDSIEKFKIELLARTRSPSPRELETYHPRNMSAGTFTPYRAPTPEEAALVLNRPVPLPSPDFVPKPILKRSSTENVPQNVIQQTNNNNNNSGGEKLDLTKGIKSFFKRDKRSATEKNTEENQILSNPNEKTNAANIAADIEVKRKVKEEEERKRKEAERLMQEESHAAVDHYSDLVREVSSTRGYHTPIYLDKDELKKITEKAAKEGSADEIEHEKNVTDHLKLRRSHSPDIGLMPPINNKPRLSISERGQMVHVRETASNLAMTAENKTKPPDTPSEDSTKQFSNRTEYESEIVTETVVSETLEERPDSRGRTRMVKVKRIIKKRMPSSTRSRDASTSRPPSSLASAQDITINNLGMEPEITFNRRTASRTRYVNQSKSPVSFRSALPNAEQIKDLNELAMIATSKELTKTRSQEQLSEEAHEKVRSALSYSTDLVLFIVACYVYIFKDAKLVLPILALLIYRQLGEAIRANIPNWMKRKKEE
ncbi:muscle M-line assembly protein unc-89 [Teleopsis dalmanni]|uniref:muscle M-line assembly protein unc-89 n=1 Tax=Teleopsis dalmanni TaxID=139649 RepID=UPI000D329D9D|nr:muscle M-line assembly protein unc-89 [Teleopsis dalmanni]